MRTLVAAAEPPDRPDVVLVPVITGPAATAIITTGWTYEAMSSTAAVPSTGSPPPPGRGTLS